MKLQTKLLILTSAALLVFSAAACTQEDGEENGTDAVSGAIAQGTSGESLSSSEETAQEPAQSESDPAESAPTTEKHPTDESLDSSPESGSEEASENATSKPNLETEADSEQGDDPVGPQPPQDSVDPLPDETQPTLPDFDGITTNEDGVIELPFVPFPD